MRQFLIAAIAMVAGSCTPSTSQSGAFTEPSVVTAVPIPADFVWRSAVEFGAWANNGLSRGAELVLDGGDPFIRLRLEPGSFTLRSPDLPADAPIIKSVRIVSRWQPSEAPPHLLNVFLAIVITQDRCYVDRISRKGHRILVQPGWRTMNEV